MQSGSAEAGIMRRWVGQIRTSDVDAYVRYVAETGLADYSTTPGSCGAELLTRDLGDGTTEVTTLSWWTSLDAIIAFAGADYDAARYYPEDDKFLLAKPSHVEHALLRASSAPD